MFVFGLPPPLTCGKNLAANQILPRFCPGTSPQFRLSRGCWQDWMFKVAANIKRSSLWILSQCCIAQIMKFDQNKIISHPCLGLNPNYLKSPAYLPPYFLNLSILVDLHDIKKLWDLFVDCGLACIVVLRTSWSHLTANGAKKSQHEGALRDTQPRSVFAHCTHSHRCCALGGGEMEVLYSHCSAVSPMCPLIY